MNWWLIALLVVIALLLFKFKEIRHKLGLVVVILLLLFLVASFGQLYTTNNLDLSNFEGVVKAGKVYFSWLNLAVHNLATVSSFVVKQEWTTNITNMTEVAGR